MKKKAIEIIIAVVVLCAAGSTFFLLHNKNVSSVNNSNIDETTNDKKQDNEVEHEDDESLSKEKGKVLVVYYSATNNTKTVAEKIAKNLNGDIFEIIPENEYTTEDLNYGNPDSRVSKEHNDERLRDVPLKNTKVENWDNYDTVLIGYPIWWQVAAWPVNTFVKSNDFKEKTVIPFCTSASSGLGDSGKLLEKEANGGKWLEGVRFNSRPTEDDIKQFTDSIK